MTRNYKEEAEKLSKAVDIAIESFQKYKPAEYPHGFLLLGAVFLCTTGAEALYSDLGHCVKSNIPYSWVFVKSCWF